MKRKNVDSMREIRLWISQVIIPLATVIGGLIIVPEARESISDKLKMLKKR